MPHSLNSLVVYRFKGTVLFHSQTQRHMITNDYFQLFGQYIIVKFLLTQ